MSDEKQGLGMLNPFYKIIFNRDLKNSLKSRTMLGDVKATSFKNDMNAGRIPVGLSETLFSGPYKPEI